MLNFNKKPGDSLAAAEINALGGVVDDITTKGTLHDLFLASGATYNQNTKMYQLNGLDLTFNEMKACYYFTYPIQFSNNWTDICNSRYFKTNVARNSHLGTFVPITFEAAFVYCTSLIKLNFLIGVNYLKVGRAAMAFSECKLLESIIGIDFSNATGTGDLANTFHHCKNLKELKIKGIANDVSFACSPLLTKDSVLNIITTATPKRPITISLHPTVYAMATADSEIQAELAKQPNISLAEREPSA